MNDARKTKAQLIEELDGPRGENTDLREKVRGVDVSSVEPAVAGRFSTVLGSMRTSRWTSNYPVCDPVTW
jgi:hypothetical protein